MGTKSTMYASTRNDKHNNNHNDNLTSAAPQHRSPLVFFLLVFALSVPFWLVGGVTGLEILPGLPIAALGAICPVLAALILCYREGKTAGMIALLKRSFDFGRFGSALWYVPTLLIMPVISVLSFIVLRLAGTAVPDPQIALGQTLILCEVFFIGALGEELGWSGYVTDPLQDRWGALRGSLLLGLVWAGWHYIALAQAQRSIEWIAWWTLGTVSARVIMVWLYNNTGKSVFAIALFHMTQNVTWQLFPVNGSYFDPRISGLLSAFVVIIILMVSRRKA